LTSMRGNAGVVTPTTVAIRDATPVGCLRY
jgi:hypothetical protein